MHLSNFYTVKVYQVKTKNVLRRVPIVGRIIIGIVLNLEVKSRIYDIEYLAIE